MTGPVVADEKLLAWGIENIETLTLEQARMTARLDIVDGYVALMPDAHVGIGSTVGSVIPTQGAIIPAAVGVDIGCGMMAAHTGLKESQLPDDLHPLHSAIAERVPSGVGQGHAKQTAYWKRFVEQHKMEFDRYYPTKKRSVDLNQTAATQFGSLGSGNHFVEVSVDQHGDVWIVLHSGSRGIGNRLATRHIGYAKNLARDLELKLEDPDLSYFVEGTTQFREYIRDMLWSQDYAKANRIAMMQEIHGAFEKALGHDIILTETVNCHHNYTQRETHFRSPEEPEGRQVWVTRKGAIRAGAGDMGIIPGSMGTDSYIVRGLGSEESFQSASHGAGRRMSRGEAKRTFTTDDLEQRMSRVRAWNPVAKGLVDEIPDSYKPIEEVMAAQADLVEPVYALRQVLNYKGQ